METVDSLPLKLSTRYSELDFSNKLACLLPAGACDRQVGTGVLRLIFKQIMNCAFAPSAS